MEEDVPSIDRINSAIRAIGIDAGRISSRSHESRSRISSGMLATGGSAMFIPARRDSTVFVAVELTAFMPICLDSRGVDLAAGVTITSANRTGSSRRRLRPGRPWAGESPNFSRHM